MKKYKINKINDTSYNVLKRKYLWKWEVVGTYINKYQAECALHRFERKNENLFTHFCAVKPKNKEHVIEELKKMGYVTSSTFNLNQKYIFTTQNGYIYSSDNNDIDKLTINKYSSLYGIYCSDNEDVFLAIAATNDRNDYMQWFYKETYDYFNKPTIINKFKCYYEKFGDLYNIYNYKKMDIDNIIGLFTNKEN
jgi:uncharacterized pyridoxamine 5'-phosphate oxidase family protein